MQQRIDDVYYSKKADHLELFTLVDSKTTAVRMVYDIDIRRYLKRTKCPVIDTSKSTTTTTVTTTLNNFILDRIHYSYILYILLLIFIFMFIGSIIFLKIRSSRRDSYDLNHNSLNEKDSSSTLLEVIISTDLENTTKLIVTTV